MALYTLYPVVMTINVRFKKTTVRMKSSEWCCAGLWYYLWHSPVRSSSRLPLGAWSLQDFSSLALHQRSQSHCVAGFIQIKRFSFGSTPLLMGVCGGGGESKILYKPEPSISWGEELKSRWKPLSLPPPPPPIVPAYVVDFTCRGSYFCALLSPCGSHSVAAPAAVSKFQRCP